MRNRSHVVEELRIDRPLFVFTPNVFADDRGAAPGDGLLQGESLLADDNIAEALIGRAILVGGRGGGGEPAFVDPATVQAEGVEVIGVEFQPFAWLEQR